MKKIVICSTLCLLILFSSCSETGNKKRNSSQPVYKDVPYLQDYAVKFYGNDEKNELKKVYTDRNGVIQILGSDGLYRPFNGFFQYPGTLEPDITYRPMADKRISDMTLYKNQFVYVDDKAVLSNAWAGKLYSRHNLPKAKLVCGGTDFTFMISDGRILAYIKDSEPIWTGNLNGDKVLEIKNNEESGHFLILAEETLYSFTPDNNELKPVFNGSHLTCFEITKNGKGFIIGTSEGYVELDASGKQKGEMHKKLPWPEITSVKKINGKLWFGSIRGAFMLCEDGTFNYYYGERWLPGNEVRDIAAGPENSVLILTDKGLGQICFKEMTLEDKAMMYEKQVRQRQIRYGINSNVTRLKNHDLSTAENHVAD